MRGRLVLISSLITGFFIRAALAPFTGHPWDVYVWLRTAELFTNGYWNVYTVSEVPQFPWGFYSYPPMWLLFLVSSYVVVGGDSAPVNYAVAAFKTPIIAADVLVALWIYRLSRVIGLDDQKGQKLAAFYALNPVAVFISGVWGMFDPLATLFALVALELLLRGHYTSSGAFLGIGVATKLFPVLLLPVTSLYVRNSRDNRNNKIVLAHVLPAVIVPLALSIPFLLDSPLSYITKLLYHASNVGQFTYWALIYPLIGKELSTIASLILFIVLYTKTLSKFLRDGIFQGSTLLKASTTMIAIFLACSTKVNVQYLLWLMPIAYIVATVDEEGIGKKLWTSLWILNTAAVIFLVYVFNITDFSIASLGRISPAGPTDVGVAGTLLVLSAILAGWQFVRLGLFEVLGRRVDSELIRRFGITSILTVLLIAMVAMPAPGGVNLSCDGDRIAVIEGPDSFFLPDGTPDVRLLERAGRPTVVVIPFGLDLMLLYDGKKDIDLDPHVKFRFGRGEWNIGRLASSIKLLKGLGVRTLLGIYTYPGKPVVSYGIQGFTTSLTESVYPQSLIGDSIDFRTRLHDRNITLAGLVAERAAALVVDLEFDGVYIITEYRHQNGVWRFNPTVMELLVELRRKIGSNALLVFDGIDPLTHQRSQIDDILKLTDIVVLRTSPWMRRLKSNFLEDAQLTRVLEEVRELLRSHDRTKFAYSLYVVDFAEGWILPGIQVRAETEELGTLLRSCVIYHASVYLPYRLNPS
ncbi:MAG: hypothetical protein RMJ75_00885 [Nitrososphaerota archaeon]|nr:hypothetical protein [Nitrososphaerota archaeon]